MPKKIGSAKNNKKSIVVSAIGRSSSEYTAQRNFFQKLTAKEIYQCFNAVVTHPYFYNSVQLTKKSGLKDIYKARTTKVELSKNISWCLALVESHSASLKKYHEIRGKLTRTILESNYDESVSLIDEIDEICGKSLWSLINRSSIESFINETNEYGYHFNTVDDNYFLNYVAFYSTSYFTDPEIFTTSRNTHFNDIKRSAQYSLRDFFLYKFFRLDTSTELDFDVIYEIERNSSIIDIFQLIIFSLEYCKVRKIKFESIFNCNINHVIATLEKCGYNYLDCIKSAYENSYFISRDDEYFDILDKYTVGDYHYVIDRCIKESLFDKDFSFAELAAKSLTRDDYLLDECFMSTIIQSMRDILVRNSKYENSLSYLSCLSNSFRTIEWFKQLGYFTERESKNKSSESLEKSEFGLHFYSKKMSPKRSIIFDKPLEYLEKLNDLYSTSNSVILMRQQGSTLPGENDVKTIENERKIKYNAIASMRTNEYEKTESMLLNLITSTDRLNKIDSLRLLSEHYIQTNEFDKLFNLIVENSIDQENLFSIFDTNTILAAVEANNISSKCIELPIVYSLHSQHVNSAFDSNLKFLFENFLNLNVLRLPTELFDKSGIYGKTRISYFLRWVCTPEIMKLYLEFSTSREIEECRLNICNYLLEQNDSLDDLQFEIKNISKNLIIRKAVQQVENSRIYVDTSLFKGRNSAPYKALFERYLELSTKKGEVPVDDIMFKTITEAVTSKLRVDKEYWKSLSIIFMPDLKLSPKNATFLSLAKLMRQEFTFGEKGINNYLSTRIRHGVLPTAVRRSSLREGIYVPQNTSVTSYRDSLSKDVNIQLLDEEFAEFLPLAKSFTAQLEEEISIFNDQKLQIYTLESPLDKNEKSQAMFNYSISPVETFALQAQLPPSPSYEDLVKIVTEWLWYRTDFILDEVKNHISDNLQSAINIKFDKFISDIQRSSISQHGKRILANAVSRAKANIRNDLNIIRSWFEHVDSDADGEFELGTAVEIAKRSLSLNLSYQENYLYKVPQRNVSYWVDVFFILFENAISKSKIDKNDVLIKLSVTKLENDRIIIECSNNTKNVPDIDSENNTLQFYKDAYGDEELTRDAIQSEGGTGFFKIWKIVARDLNIEHEIDFGYKTSNQFSVSLLLKI